MDSSTQSILLDLLNYSTSQNQKLYVVGGTFRDYLSRKPCTDFDLTGENAAEIGSCFSRSLNFTCVPLDNTPGRQTVRVILDQKRHLDFTDLQGKNIEEDLSQRDFTINAMGQLLSDFLSERKNIIDPYKGQEDFKNRKIRVLQGPIFQSDPVRMLRAYPYAEWKGCQIDELTFFITRVVDGAFCAFGALNSAFGALNGAFCALNGAFCALNGAFFNFGALGGDFGALDGVFGALNGAFGAFGALDGAFGALDGAFRAFGALDGAFGAFGVPWKGFGSTHNPFQKNGLIGRIEVLPHLIQIPANSATQGRAEPC